jgi:type 1 glutamine amidotransferase
MTTNKQRFLDAITRKTAPLNIGRMPPRRQPGQRRAHHLGHFDWTFDDPFFRTIVLRGIAWAAGESPYRFDPLILRGIPLKD